MSAPDTIYAPASGSGRSAISVIRISGPATQATIDALAGPRPEARRAVVRALRQPQTGEILDRALVLWLPGPASFTGEDMAELHIHGGIAVRAAVVRALGELSGLRSAEPGEFTRRAFLNGRMDLSAVEGLADLIDAETESQRRQAVRQLDGALTTIVVGWRERLIDTLAWYEAALDFADEDDVPAGAAEAAAARLYAIRLEVDAELARGRRGERLRDGFVVVIAGPPNAGKSTLLNVLARREVAIVSPHAGTTRDAIEVRCDLDGLPVVFVDTAGLRETSDPVEQIGIAHARRRLEDADLVLWLAEPGQGFAIDDARGSTPRIRIATKADRAGIAHDADLAVSAATGVGMDSLLALVQRRASDALVGSGDAVLTRERHRRAFEDLAAALMRGEGAASLGRDELAAEDVRLALRALGRVTGAVDVEDILDRVFSEFCIGK